MDDVDPKGAEQSAYNEAVNQLKRLDRLYSLCHEYGRLGFDAKWRDTLDCIWRELSCDAIRKHGNGESVDIFVIEKANPYHQFMRQLDEKIAKAGNRGELRVLLSAKERWLRWLQDTVGKGGRYEDPEDERSMVS